MNRCIDSIWQLIKHPELLGILSILFVGSSCVESYDIPSSKEGYIIVEGYISNVKGDHEIKISRSGPVANIRRDFDKETGAKVSVVVDGTQEVPFDEGKEGVYRCSDPLFGAEVNREYYLKIILKDKREFRSEIAQLQKGPDISTLQYKVLDGSSADNQSGVDRFRLVANGTSTENVSGFYRYVVKETWETRALASSGYVLRLNFKRTSIGEPYLVTSVDTLVNDPTNNICWPTIISDNLQLNSTRSLTTDALNNVTVHEVDLASSRFLYKYSAEVYQYALDEKAYQFINLIKSFSEEDGLLFSKQPGSLEGNIYEVGTRSDQVLGLFQVSERAQKRLSIANEDFPPAIQTIIKSGQLSCGSTTLSVPYTDECELEIINTPDSKLTRTERSRKSALILSNIVNYELVDSLVAREGHFISNYIEAPKSPCSEPLVVDLIYTARANCVDCGSRSGLNAKPEWWDAEF